MAIHRMDRVNELLKREVGLFLFRLGGSESIDLSRVTVTRVDTTPNLRDARVYVAIRADESGQSKILSVLRRRRSDFQKTVARNMKLKYTPRLHFAADTAPEKGHKILCLLEELEKEEGDRLSLEKEPDYGPDAPPNSRPT
jgi:ribosome-binding factor A